MAAQTNVHHKEKCYWSILGHSCGASCELKKWPFSLSEISEMGEYVLGDCWREAVVWWYIWSLSYCWNACIHGCPMERYRRGSGKGLIRVSDGSFTFCLVMLNHCFTRLNLDGLKPSRNPDPGVRPINRYHLPWVISLLDKIRRARKPLMKVKAEKVQFCTKKSILPLQW